MIVGQSLMPKQSDASLICTQLLSYDRKHDGLNLLTQALK